MEANSVRGRRETVPSSALHTLSPVKPQRPPLRAPAALVAPFARQEDVTEHLAMSAAGTCAAADDDDTSDEDEDHDEEDDPEMKDEAASERLVYMVCNDNVWKIISPTAYPRRALLA